MKGKNQPFEAWQLKGIDPSILASYVPGLITLARLETRIKRLEAVRAYRLHTRHPEVGFDLDADEKFQLAAYQALAKALIEQNIAAEAKKPEPVAYVRKGCLAPFIEVKQPSSLKEGDELFTSLPPNAMSSLNRDYFAYLVEQARTAAARAMVKFPQPNYVLAKVSEEHGEVVKAVVHYMEGRERWVNVEKELIDNLAMLIRLLKEGDQVIGFTPPWDVIKYDSQKEKGE